MRGATHVLVVVVASHLRSGRKDDNNAQRAIAWRLDRCCERVNDIRTPDVLVLQIDQALRPPNCCGERVVVAVLALRREGIEAFGDRANHLRRSIPCRVCSFRGQRGKPVSGDTVPAFTEVLLHVLRRLTLGNGLLQVLKPKLQLVEVELLGPATKLMAQQALDQRKRKLTPTVDSVSYEAARASTAFLQFQGRSSESLEAR